MVQTTVTLLWPPVVIVPVDIPAPVRQVIPEMVEPVQVCILVVSMKLKRTFVFKNLLKHLNFEMVWVYYKSKSSTLEKSQIFRILQCFILTLTWNAQIGLKKVLTLYNNITKITKTGVIKVIWN